MMNDKIRESIILGALLHDIGKFWQRCEEKGGIDNASFLDSNVRNTISNDICPGRKYGDVTILTHQHVAWTYQFLTKFESKTHGSLSKQQLQRIVNHTGYEKEFDERVLTLLIQELKSHAKRAVFFSIEISAVSLRNSQFKHFLTTLFDAEKIQPSQFILEINEIKSYEELRRFREIINAYHELGFKIALGNFGGNNASLEYLKSLPVDMIKLDIEFTKKADEIKYELLLKHFIELARVLHIQSMVKFIDKEALFEKIKAYEPDFIQGFYISKPKKIGELDEIR